jgi:hypothetical protein
MAELTSDLGARIIKVLWRQPTALFSCDRLSELTAFPTVEVQATVAQLHEEGLITLFHTGRGVVVALADTRAAREQAICLTKEASPVLNGQSTCRHHWKLATPYGDSTYGVCRLCGAERYFLSSTSSARAWRGGVSGKRPSRADSVVSPRPRAD